MSKKKMWTWADHPIYGRGRGVIKDEGRSLSYGDATVIVSVARNDPVIGLDAFRLIPKMCAVLNAHWREAAPPGNSLREALGRPACHAARDHARPERRRGACAVMDEVNGLLSPGKEKGR